MRTRRVLSIAPAVVASLSAVVHGYIGFMTWSGTGRAASPAQMLEARQAIMQAIDAEAFDEARIRAAATVSLFEAGGAVSMAKLFQKIRAVLTPDQQQLLQDAWSRPSMWARDPNTSPV